MSTIESLGVNLVLFNDEFSQALIKSDGDLGDFAASATKSILKIGASVAAMSGGLGKIGLIAHQASVPLGVLGSILGGPLGAVVGIAGVGAAAYGGKMGLDALTNAAANVNEQVNKTKFLFGDAAGIILDSADDMARSFGLPKAQILDATASIGVLAQGAGLADDAAAKMGVSMAQLAVDASSINNVPIDVALMKIRAGLVGETEPLRAFGVTLSQQKLEAEAAAIGFVKLNNQYTEGEKVQARAAVIARELAYATGDLERTFDSAANRMRAIEGTWSNIAADLGMAIQPATDLGLAIQYHVTGSLAFAARQALNTSEALQSVFSTTADLALLIGNPAAIIFPSLRGEEPLDPKRQKIEPPDPGKLKAAADLVALTNRLEVQVATFGLASTAVDLYKLKQAGLSEQAIATTRGLQEQVAQLGRSKAFYETLGATKAGFQFRIDTAGLTRAETEAYKLQKAFEKVGVADPGRAGLIARNALDGALALAREAEAAEELQRNLKEIETTAKAAFQSAEGIGAGIVSAIRTPLEGMRAEIATAMDAFDAGVIPLDILNRALDQSTTKITALGDAVRSELTTPLDRYNLRVAELDTLRDQGSITPDQRDLAVDKASEKAIEAIGRETGADKFLARAEQLTEQLRTPFQKLTDTMSELNEFRTIGRIDEGTFVRGRNQALVDFVDDKKSGQVRDTKASAAALELGTTEAYSQLVKFEQGGEKNGIKDVAKNTREQVKATEKQTVTLQQALREFNQPLTAFIL